MKLKNILSLVCLGTAMACTILDIPPMNIVGEPEIFQSKQGVTSYVSRMYSTLPMEDFRYAYHNGDLFHKSDTRYQQQDCLTGDAVGRDTKGAEQESAGYWDNAYKWIREANMFLETLPEYSSYHLQSDVDNWTGEAYFCRAFIYYSLVKRYGGVPIVDKVVDYPATVTFEGTQMFRDAEEKVWDFIGEDLDKAYELLPDSNQKGRADKSAAAALKSRVMLHAGSIAKYNTVDEEYNGVRICGIPASRAKDYFKAAYEASKLVDGGKYGLYMDEWKDGDKAAQTANYESIFTKDTKEIIFGRWYKSPDSVHNFDDSAQPMQTSTGGNNSEICPTLDFVEMFDGFDKDSDGHIANFDASGHYKLYSSPVDFFADCEPRLRATVILPMDRFKGQVIDLRRGIWTGASASTIEPLLDPNYVGNYNSVYTDATPLKLANGSAFSNTEANKILTKNGTRMTRSGASGVFSEWDFGCISGFYLRKYLNPVAGSNNNGNQSSQTWIELRYAEVLLNRAEAAFELVLSGESTAASGESYRSEAFKCVNEIRRRAGADLLVSEAALDLDVVRKEIRKELAFEHKTWWNLKRWRVIDKEQNNRRYRTLASFYSVEDDKYFLDQKYQEPRGGNNYIFTYDTRYYYQPIPGNEITRNPNCKQNPGF